MSSDTLEERMKQIEEFDNFTELIDKELSDITAALGWTLESIAENNEVTITCPYDSSHQIYEKSLSKHLSKCQWKAEGYEQDDVPFSEPTFPPDAPSTIRFDEHLQDTVLKTAKEKNPSMEIESYHCLLGRASMGERLIPRTSDRLLTDFTRDERLALYEYVVANTSKPDLGHDIPDINKPKAQQNENKEMSLWELLAQERNMKRRRAKHRGVHTNKKSHTEILREVINQQMEIYSEYLSEQNNTESNVVLPQERTVSEHRGYTEGPSDVNNRSHLRYSHFVPEGGNGHYYSSQREKQEHWQYSSRKEYSEARKRKRRESYSPHVNEESKEYKRSEHKHRSRSKDKRKSHKKEKHRSKDRHKKKRHRSQDRDSSSDRNHAKHKHRSRKQSRS